MTLMELYKEDGPLRYGQDKFGQHYAEVYDVIFEPFQNKEINVFEVGYFNGGSSRLWLDYFPKAKVDVIDINPEAIKRHAELCVTTHPELIDLKLDSSRYTLTLMDANDLNAEFFKGKEPDIAIDDGSHELEDQLNFIKIMYPIVKEGGLIIIEDVAHIEKVKPEFEKLGIPFVVADMRPPRNPEQFDSVLIIIQK